MQDERKTTTYKIFTNVINTGLKNVDYQNSFSPGRSRVIAMHRVVQIHQKLHGYHGNLPIIFIDFKSTFNSLNRSKLVEELKTLKMPIKIPE